MIERARKRIRRMIGSANPTKSMGVDENFGPVAETKIPERWVSSTCGYCSVGCGMLLGVKENEVITVKGDPSHPVNQGKLCPKGLCEHEGIRAEGRAELPLLHIRVR